MTKTFNTVVPYRLANSALSTMIQLLGTTIVGFIHLEF